MLIIGLTILGFFVVMGAVGSLTLKNQKGQIGVNTNSIPVTGIAQLPAAGNMIAAGNITKSVPSQPQIPNTIPQYPASQQQQPYQQQPYQQQQPYPFKPYQQQPNNNNPLPRILSQSAYTDSIGTPDSR